MMLYPSDTTNHRDKFIAGVESELAFLGRVEERRQEMLKEVGRKRWSNPDVAMTNFVNHLAFVYQDAFLQEATVGLSNNCATFDGPFIRFAKAILDALKENLSEVVRATPLVALLNRMVTGNSALWNRFIRSDYHQLVNGEGWFPDLTDEIKKP
ncbi:MAG: hypothetical protein NTY41_08460 [Proteobacteria bacterium]|nr:hypothetical protein [Pseudomonadota bacterium]